MDHSTLQDNLLFFHHYAITGPTSQLVNELFRNLKAVKLEKAEALSQAQLTLLRSTERSPYGSIHYSDPFCWAAFVITGEWK